MTKHGNILHRLFAAAAYAALVCVVSLAVPFTTAYADAEITILCTSNLEGRFSLSEKNQNADDPMLLLAQTIIDARKRQKIDLYLDLGNGFYPGSLSKYSFGSVMMDYFNYFGCDAVLVASKDLRIGMDNLEFLQKGKTTRLLSANIGRGEKPAFRPYFVAKKGALTVAFIAVSSTKIRFDIAEKNVYNIQLDDPRVCVDRALRQLTAGGAPRHVVLLSGLSMKETIALLDEFRGIDAAICGGDNAGELYGGRASRIDLADGRTVAMLPESQACWVLTMTLDGEASIKSARRLPARKIAADPGEGYHEFANRLALWKRKFQDDNSDVILKRTARDIVIGDMQLTFLLRDRFNAEVSAIDAGTLAPAALTRDMTRADLTGLVNQDYNLFTFKLTGADLKNIAGRDESLLINGFENGRVQGYLVENTRRYRVAATQSSFEKIEQLLGKDIPFVNSWTNVTDVILADFSKEKTLLRDDYSYIDRRFRATIDFYLSNFIDNSCVKKGSSIEEPAGRPAETYRKWGLENKIDFTLYNRLHQFVVTPYMLYVRQDEQYLQNLLRGTLLYNLNLGDAIRPYHKSQIETVLRETNGLRPIMVRETVGAYLITTLLKGKIGAGFEKQVRDPVLLPVYGVETIVNVRVPFLGYFSYVLNVDSFISLENMKAEDRYIRSEIENALTAAVNSFLGVSVRYKWFYLYSRDYREKYENSQLIASLDVKTDFKMW